MKFKVFNGAILISAIFLASIAAGSIAFASDLSWTVDTIVTINGANYTIKSGSAATSLTVGATTLTVTVPNGSIFTLYSGSPYTLNSNPNITETCTTSDNQLVVTGSATVVVTPDPLTTCTIPVIGSSRHSSSGDGGGSGGGGGSTVLSESVLVTPTISVKEDIKKDEVKAPEKDKKIKGCDSKKKTSLFPTLGQIFKTVGSRPKVSDGSYKKLMDSVDFDCNGEFNLKDVLIFLKFQMEK